ncbi:TetR/AcrR family transcriptional regulator [Actinosynnema sp. CS-041913]|uniref:TetR/AcrR family transcriptional regulator n=1 Tax=Actinosynnema sp. CS-041913 TaxID=3239917 RepID=UPI003D937E6A
MARVSRAETQERNRVKVLTAARDEFAERGFREAKIDTIAERAGLTRGAVYSNFPGKRALYFAVLADQAERAYPSTSQTGAFAEPGPEGGAFAHHSPEGDRGAVARTGDSAANGAPVDVQQDLRSVLGALALAWVRPLTGDDWLGRDLLPELLAEDLRHPYTQLLELDALLLGLAMTRLRGAPAAGGAVPRLVRQAEVILGTLHGAHQLAAAAPGFLEPYDVVSACERLAGLALNDWWSPLPPAPPVRSADEAWTPPPAVDLVRGEPVTRRDGVVAILGLNRLVSAEQAVRSGAPTTVVMVTSAPQELAPLSRLTVAQLCGPLRQSFPVHAWPDVQVVSDESGTFAKAAGVPAVSDETETAVEVRNGRIVRRADGYAACHAVSAPS